MGKILVIVLIILLVIFLAVTGLGIYFYNYYVFKTLRVCISNAANDTLLVCDSDLECKTNFLGNNSEKFAKIESFENLVESIYFSI